MNRGGAQSASVCLAGFLVAVTGWIGICVASGLAQWRVSQQEDGATDAVWVGIWRACVLGSASTVRLRCYHFQLDTAPSEVIGGQVLMTLAMLIGAVAKVVSTAGLRLIFFGDAEGADSPYTCTLAGGTLFCAASLVTMAPLAWHTHAVNARQDVVLPSELSGQKLQLSLPLAQGQVHGTAIYLGFCSALLMLAGGVVLASCYRTFRQRLKVHPCFRDGRLARASLASLYSFPQPNGSTRSRSGSGRGSPALPPRPRGAACEPPGELGHASPRASGPSGDHEQTSLQMSPIGNSDWERTAAGNTGGSEQQSTDTASKSGQMSTNDLGRPNEPEQISSQTSSDRK